MSSKGNSIFKVTLKEKPNKKKEYHFGNRSGQVLSGFRKKYHYEAIDT